MAPGNVAVDRDGIQWPRSAGIVAGFTYAALLAVGLGQRTLTPWTIGAAVAVAAVCLADVIWFIPRWMIGVVTCVGAVIIGSRGDNLALFLLICATGEVATTGTFVDLGVTALAAYGALAIRIASADQYGFNNYGAWLFGIGAAAGGGSAIRGLLRLNAQLRAAQAEVAAQATVEERRRLAREIHDVIAHSMTVTMLHITAARLALQDDPPSTADAIDALAEAEAQGRKSLADIRQTVGLLTTDEERLAPPVMGAADLPDLVESFRHAGLQVEWSVSGDLERLSAAAGTAAYRVVQECLANAAKHAPGAPVAITIQVHRRNVGVCINNGAPTAPSTATPGGRGLAGMAQRVLQAGGRLRAGPQGQGWQVEADLPVECSDTPVISTTDASR